MRVSRSGGWTSVIRPHSNRLRSRSSRVTSCLRRPVAGDDDLLVGVVERVERVEELLLRPLLVLQELDVVDEQDVDVAVAPLEAVGLVVADRVDEVVGELLGAHVAHPGPGEQARAVVADRVQQVGLAQAGLAVDEQRVVRLGRRLGDGDRGRVREPVARADDEGLERVLRVEPGRLALRAGLRARGRCRGCPAAARCWPGAAVVGLGAGLLLGDDDGRRGRPSRRRRSASRLGSTTTAIRRSRPSVLGQDAGDDLAQPGLDDVLGELVAAPRAARCRRPRRPAG